MKIFGRSTKKFWNSFSMTFDFILRLSTHMCTIIYFIFLLCDDSREDLRDEPEGTRRAGKELFCNGYYAERHLPDGFSTDHK